MQTKRSKFLTIAPQFKYGLFALELIREERKLSLAKEMKHEDKKEKAQDIVRNHVGFAMGAAMVPVPGVDLLAVSAVQLNMLRQLAKLYNQGFVDGLGRSVISAVAGGSVARLGASLVKAIPGVGTVIGEMSMPILSGASTYALGRVIASHLNHGGMLSDLDLGMARKQYKDEIETGKELARASEPVKSGELNGIEKLRQLATLRDEGILTDAEFQQMKEKMLASI